MTRFKINEDELPLPNVPKLVAALIVATLGCLSFHASLTGEFVFDDKEAIVRNKDVLPEAPVSAIFSHDFWGDDIKSRTSHKSYRPLTVLTFRLDCILAGGLKPLGFHTVNVFLHGINCVLVLWTFSILLPKDDNLEELQKTFVSKASFLAAALFAVHPIHTESVAGIVGRADLLCCLFFLLAFLSYKQALVAGENGGKWEYFHLLKTVTYGALSMFSKEQGATAFGVCAVYDILHAFEQSDVDLQNLLRGIETLTNDSKKAIRKMIVRVVILALATLGLLWLRFAIMDSSPPKFQTSDNPAAFADSVLSRFLSYNYIYSINAWLLLNPWWLCFDWSMGCVPVVTSLTDWRALCPIAFWAVLTLLILKALAFFTSKDFISRNIILGLTFLVIPFLPATNLLFTVGFVVAERVLYIPSIGFAFLVVLGFTCLLTNEKLRTCSKGMCFLLLALHMARSIQRSFDWLSEDALFSSGEHVCPLNAKVHYNIGKILSDKGDGKRAIQYYLESIRLNPRYDQPLNNLGNLLKDLGRNKEAETYLERAVEVSPRFATGWMNLGIVKSDLKKYEESETCYLNALQFRKPYPDAHFNLGNLYIATNRQQLALKQFDATLSLDSNHGSAWTNKILLLDNMGDHSQAVETGEAAIRQMPNDATLLYNLGNILGKAGKFQESENYLLKAIEKNPLESSYHGNLGVLYHRWQKYKAAERHYLRSIELDPKNHFTMDNYKKLKRAMLRS